MATPAPALRPLSIGEILDAGIKVVLRNWKTLIGCTIVLMAPLSLFYVVAIASIDPEQLELIPETTTEPGELPEASEFIGYGVTFFIGAIALCRVLRHLLQGRQRRVAGQEADRRRVAALRAAPFAAGLRAVGDLGPVLARRLDPVLRAR